MFLKAVDNADEQTEEDIQREFKKINEEFLNGMSLEESFDYSQNYMIEDLKKLPLNILNEVKDIRVLALNYTSSKVYKMIKEYCKANEKFVEAKLRESVKAEEEQFKNKSIGFLEESFHDSFIEKINK